MRTVAGKWDAARQILDESFTRAEAGFFADEVPEVPADIHEACGSVFASKTQAYREVLVGCLLTRLTEPTRDVRLPYLDLGDNAFSGRSLDERVVNPFLHERDIPCSRGPYLSCFRRQVAFDETTRARLRDKTGYDAFLAVLDYLEAGATEEDARRLLDHVMYRFVLLREESNVELFQLGRISLSQYAKLIDGLLARPSGGVFPCLLVLSMVETIAQRFTLPWEIDAQGINVADKASGTGGDICIRRGGERLLTIEVTERQVDAARVRATFRAKIATAGLRDYVFVVHLERVQEEARQQAEKYFSQGHDVSFADIREWLVNSLVTVGAEGREHFHSRMREHLGGSEIPKALKVAWNDEVEKLTR